MTLMQIKQAAYVITSCLCIFAVGAAFWVSVYLGVKWVMGWVMG
jgi:hypothetical protein